MCDFLSSLQTQFQGLSTANQIGTVAKAGGGLMGGMSQFEAGQAGKAAYGYNAQIAKEEAQDKASTTEQSYDKLMGRQASLYAKAGVSLTSGSPLLVMTATAAQKGKEESEIKRSGQEQANLDRYYGKQTAFAGTMGGVGAFLKGLAGAATNMYGGGMTSDFS